MNAQATLATLTLTVQTVLVITLVAVHLDTLEMEHTAKVFIENVPPPPHILLIKITPRKNFQLIIYL